MHEWPMKTKAKWPVKELMDKKQRRLLRGWLRHAENLDGPEEMVQICELKTGRILDEENEMGSVEDLKNCQEGREEIPNCQVGKELRSLRDLIDCHEDSQGISHGQVGNGLRSLRDEHMRLSKGLINLEVSLNQPEEMIEEEDQMSLLMIGGIQVFLPHSLGEAEIFVAYAAKISEIGRAHV